MGKKDYKNYNFLTILTHLINFSPLECHSFNIKLDIKKKIHNGGKNCSKMRPINHPIAGIESVREPNRLI